MFREPRWRRRWRTRFKFHSAYNHSSSKRVLGGLLCLVGVGIVLAALPGWIYLFLLGGGMVFCGMIVMQ